MMGRRGSSTTCSDNEDDGHRRPPFRPLQHLRTSHSPTQSVLKSTPPREVILTPRATPKPLKRKALSRPKRTATTVKAEPPEIDVSKIRPPSPSDDPLLLSGTPPARGSPRLRAHFTPTLSSSPPTSSFADPPLSFAARLTAKRFDSVAPNASSDTGVYAPLRFDTLRTIDETSGAWSDSDDDGFDLTGEYTGKFKVLQVPIKADPPTREPLEPWGRPVSPFPYSAIMERSLPLDERDADECVTDAIMSCKDLDLDGWEVATEPPPSDVELSPPPSASEDEFADLDDALPIFDVEAESTQVRPLVKPFYTEELDQTSLEEEEEEAQIDRELSVAIDEDPDTRSRPAVDSMEGDSSGEEDDVEGEDIIKITSDDPKAAARAAAILRLHDYDCILAAERKKRAKARRNRRKTIENAGISKSYVDLRSPPCKIPLGCETSPGSHSLPLLEVWRDAEDSVFLEHHSMSYCDTSFTLSPLKPTITRPPPLLPPPGEEWNRDCWKSLDKCLVAERLAVAAARGLGADLLANPIDISKEAVLDRFTKQLGGESVLAGLGSDWSRDNLIMRIDVLIKKQSRRSTCAPTLAHKDPEPRYRDHLRDAMSISGTRERYPTSASLLSDTTVVSGRHAPHTVLPDVWLPSRLESYGRDPIRTPSRTPGPRAPHPKDQVCLRHESPLPPPKIPAPARPKRLVDLRHCSPIKSDRGIRRPTARRSSGFGVKDLVRQFESLDR